MKKIIIAALFSLIVLTGCGGELTPEEKAIQIDFNMNFDTLDNEQHTANFVVKGIPNDEEFLQIEEAILNSLNAQDLDTTNTYLVKVYSNKQDIKSDSPAFGTLQYRDKSITSNNLKNITPEKYIKF